MTDIKYNRHTLHHLLKMKFANKNFKERNKDGHIKCKGGIPKYGAEQFTQFDSGEKHSHVTPIVQRLSPLYRILIVNRHICFRVSTSEQ